MNEKNEKKRSTFSVTLSNLEYLKFIEKWRLTENVEVFVWKRDPKKYKHLQLQLKKFHNIQQSVPNAGNIFDIRVMKMPIKPI